MGVPEECFEAPGSVVRGSLQRVWRVPRACFRISAACFGALGSVIRGYLKRYRRVPTACLDGIRSGLEGRGVSEGYQQRVWKVTVACFVGSPHHVSETGVLQYLKDFLSLFSRALVTCFWGSPQCIFGSSQRV